jgi:glutaredoxin
MARARIKSKGRLTVYGTAWCPDSAATRRLLNKHDVQYKYVDINKDAKGADRVMALADGNRSVPTLVFSDDRVLVEPSHRELRAALGIEEPAKRWWWPF